MSRRIAFLLISFGLVATATGCVSARMSDTETDRLFRAGDFDAAAARLRAGFDEHGQEEGRDSLLYLFDLGLTLHTAGKYEESNKVFQQADRLAEIKDYTSLATEAGTLLVSENMKSYKAEDFEYVMISVYLAMNYAALGDNENALVEARRVNRKLGLMVSEGKKPYKLNAFARYLAGVLYEAEGQWDDAQIDYKGALELTPGAASVIGPALWRSAKLGGHSEAAERWQTQFGLSAAAREEALKVKPKGSLGEIVVLYENGISPRKRPSPSYNAVPEFFPRYNPVPAATVQIDGPDGFKDVGTTVMLHDIEATAIANLQDKYAAIIAKKIAGAVAKVVVAKQVENQTKSKELGFLTQMLLFAADQADLRSWNLLPKDLQVLRIPVTPGLRTVKLKPVGAEGAPTLEKAVQVSAGKKVFVAFRYMP